MFVILKYVLPVEVSCKIRYACSFDDASVLKNLSMADVLRHFHYLYSVQPPFVPDEIVSLKLLEIIAMKHSCSAPNTAQKYALNPSHLYAMKVQSGDGTLMIYLF